MIFYGTYREQGDSEPSGPASLAWTISGNSETVTISDFRLITINSATFYLARIPFEVRSLGDGTALDASPEVLALADTDVVYQRSVTVNGDEVGLPEGKRSFRYGKPSLGWIERIDITGETFEEWSLRFFGRLVSPGGDEDGDGVSNEDEFHAGTDPSDLNSGLSPMNFSPLPGGGFQIEFNSKAGVRYQVEKAELPGSGETWVAVGNEITGDGAAITVILPDEPGKSRMFFRIRTVTP